MAEMAAVNAGVSLVSGIAGISAKNKAAAAQRKQLEAQSYQQAQAAAANEMILASQQQLARSQYDSSVLAKFAQFQQADYALQAQKSMAALDAQQKAYAVQSQQLQQQGAAATQLEQLKRQAVQVELGADAQRQAASADVANQAEAGAGTLMQVANAVTDAQRKEYSLAASGKLDSTSNDVTTGRDLSNRIAQALSVGLQMDSTQVQAAMQAFNQDELATIGERLGLLDNAQAAGTVAANLGVMRTSSDAALRNITDNQGNTDAAIEFARQNNGILGMVDAQGAANAYRAADYSLGVQRSVGRETAAIQQGQTYDALRATRGAGLMDYLAIGMQSGSAAAPMLYGNPSQGRAPAGWNPSAISDRFGFQSSMVPFASSASAGVDTNWGTLGTSQLPGLKTLSGGR